MPSSRLASDTPMRRPDSPGVLERVASMQTPAKDSTGRRRRCARRGGSPLGGSSSGRKPMLAGRHRRERARTAPIVVDPRVYCRAGGLGARRVDGGSSRRAGAPRRGRRRALRRRREHRWRTPEGIVIANCDRLRERRGSNHFCRRAALFCVARAIVETTARSSASASSRMHVQRTA